MCHLKPARFHNGLSLALSLHMQTVADLGPVVTVLILFLFGFNSSSTIDGRPNRGGPVSTGPSAEKERGGTTSDWSQGNGRPGSAPSHVPRKG